MKFFFLSTSVQLCVGFLVSPALKFCSSTDLQCQAESGNDNNVPVNMKDSITQKVETAVNILSKVAMASTLASTYANAATEGVKLNDLPYPYDGLEPFISKNTLTFHHDKHHAKYVSTTNSMIKGTELETASLETIMKKSFNTNKPLFNNAAQSWNHDFYWKCMKPYNEKVKNEPSTTLLTAINKKFGSLEDFKKEFKATGLATFGSGWVWLSINPSSSNGLELSKTIGADNPVTQDSRPILTMDVWEHAYYLDYQNDRGKYEDNFLEKLINWDFVSKQYDLALKNKA